MSNTYVRKTDNPNMGWSDERRAKYSAQCKEAHANGTRYKKSKKAVGLAISNGKKEAIKRKNRSEGQKRRHQEAKERDILGQTIDEILVPSSPKVDDQVNIKELRKEVPVNEPRPPRSPFTIVGCTRDELENAVVDLFDLIEDQFGVRPNYNDFLNDAVEEKLERCKEALCR